MNNDTTIEPKVKALAEFLECEADEITDCDDGRFEHGIREYLVLDDSEADEKCAEAIEESLWAFNASFILSECGIFEDGAEESLAAMQSKSCESANGMIKGMIKGSDGGLEGFIESAISADGRGHFLSGYDGNENEQGEYFIYRTN